MTTSLGHGVSSLKDVHQRVGAIHLGRKWVEQRVRDLSSNGSEIPQPVLPKDSFQWLRSTKHKECCQKQGAACGNSARPATYKSLGEHVLACTEENVHPLNDPARQNARKVDPHMALLSRRPSVQTPSNRVL